MHDFFFNVLFLSLSFLYVVKYEGMMLVNFKSLDEFKCDHSNAFSQQKFYWVQCATCLSVCNKMKVEIFVGF